MKKNRKKRGFTLLEIIIVIIIIGVLATLGFTQYGRMVERSRGAEARAIAGDIRKFAQAYYMEQGTLAGFANAAANIGAANDQIPSACRTSHYFQYAIGVATPSLTVTAARCTAGGKTPNAPAGAGNYILISNLATGVDDATQGTGNY
jgi:prepilin-type N-terminal cleavage/methylation domain-containing protein